MKRLLFFLILIFPFTVYGETTMENFKNSPERRWQFFTDQVMGGKSYGKLNFVSENNIKFARMAGNVTTENNGAPLFSVVTFPAILANFILFSETKFNFPYDFPPIT